MMSTPFLSDSLLQMSLDLLIEKGWKAFSLEALAQKAQIPLRELHGHFITSEDVLSAFFEAVDQKVSQHIHTFPPHLPFEERLLESLMVRFELFQAYRPLILRLYQDSFTSPCLSFFLMKETMSRLENLLKALGINSSWDLSIPLLWLYGRGFFAWVTDDSPDLSKTLFILDQQIKKFAPFFEKKT